MYLSRIRSFSCPHRQLNWTSSKPYVPLKLRKRRCCNSTVRCKWSLRPRCRHELHQQLGIAVVSRWIASGFHFRMKTCSLRILSVLSVVCSDRSCPFDAFPPVFSHSSIDRSLHCVAISLQYNYKIYLLLHVSKYRIQTAFQPTDNYFSIFYLFIDSFFRFLFFFCIGSWSSPFLSCPPPPPVMHFIPWKIKTYF